MKLKLSLFIIALLVSLMMSAQVDNYALKLTSGGTADFRSIPELDNLNSYTIQFWVNPSAWIPGATILKRGEGEEEFSVRLSSGNQIELLAGAKQISVESESLVANQWNQVTLINNNGFVEVYLDNQLKHSETFDFTIPASANKLLLGGNGFEGRIDEFRIWDRAVVNPFFHLWRNTVNKHHPNWNNLLVYYKFDQNLCDHIVDYKFKHHGIFTGIGATRNLVDDNQKFKYRKSVGYSDFSRWADRQIDKEKYLLSNDLILLVLHPKSDGTIKIPYPYNEGEVVNGNYLPGYQGRNGVLSLNGTGASMKVGADVLNPQDKYSFSSWIYLEEWTEGAYIFKKEKSENEGFSIRLGDEAKKRIIIRVNGVEYSRIYKMTVNEWVHLGVSAYAATKNQVYQTTFNGVTSYATNNSQEENSYTLSGLENTPAYIGLNLHAKFDETVVGNAYRSQGNMQQAMVETPIPSDTKKVDASTLFTFDSYWSYDNPDNMGYDYHSYKHFVSIMKQNYEGYRGFKIRAGIGSFNGWQDRFGDPGFQAKFADEVARIAEEFDGVDLDFEWCYSSGCWENYGQVIDAVRDKFPANKVFTVTPHYVSYQLPAHYVDLVDYFPFQIYGPSKTVFQWSTYVDAFNRFTANNRFPKEKIVLSYATTTSKGYDPVTDQQSGAPPVGVRNGLLEGEYLPSMNSVVDGGGLRRYFTGYDQVIDRCEFIHDKDLGGIMYWDMGNDVKTNHQYSLVKAASYSLNSNVDTLVNEVEMISTSIDSPEADHSEMRIYPNPAKSEITVMLPGNDRVDLIEIIDLAGKVVRRFHGESHVNISDLERCVYLIKVVSKLGQNYLSKVIIE